MQAGFQRENTSIKRATIVFFPLEQKRQTDLAQGNYERELSNHAETMQKVKKLQEKLETSKAELARARSAADMAERALKYVASLAFFLTERVRKEPAQDAVFLFLLFQCDMAQRTLKGVGSNSRLPCGLRPCD